LKSKTAKAEPSTQAIVFHWPAIWVTLLVGAMACGLVAAQLSYADDPQSPRSQLSLSNLSERIPALESTGTNWVQRDRYCVGLSALGRQLDQVLNPNARVFIPDMLGPTNASSTGYYYFLKNYLFPREVAISLDGKAMSTDNGFTGVPCDSPALLKSNGFDVVIRFGDNGPQLIPLTTNALRPQ
jgi:hypothetical protein